MWQIEFTFKISGKGTLHGDGFALWLTKTRPSAGPVFGSADRFEGLGIFFDTYKNNRPGTVFPYVMAMVGDGNTPYDQPNDGKANEKAGCSDQNLKLELQYKSEGEWTTCFDTTEIRVPSVSYLGFSAETGELSDNFDIINVSTKNLYSASAPGSSSTKKTAGTAQKANSSTSTSGGGSWAWFFIKIVLFFAVCGGGYVGFTLYRSQKRGSRF
ncbi:hypothetical protein MRB53_038795 [Persea americana]|nr:hypothetical protein MRB53_038795 [Persea americana]